MSVMTSPLSIQAGLPITGSGAPALSSTPTHPPPAAEAKPVQLFVNPSYQFDPTVGIVVIQFHNEAGAVSNSIPSARQLEAYRTHQETPPGEQPPAVPQTSDGKTSAG
jgi:hypothetical protein